MAQTFGDIPYDKMHLVRVQGGLEGVHAEGTSLILDRSGSGRADDMNTFHFALNGVVGNHAMGKQFNGSEYVIIAPLEAACQEARNIPSGLNPVDTYFHADTKGTMALPQAIFAAPEDAAVPEDLLPRVRRYPRGATLEETMQNRNTAVRGIFAELDAPMHTIGDHYWADFPDVSPDDKKNLAQHLCGNHEVSGDLAFYSVSEEWSRKCATITAHLENYKQGERFVQKDTGVDTALFPEIEKRMDDLRAFIAERQANQADPKSIAFYQRGLPSITARLEGILPLRRTELKKEVSYYSQYHVSPDGKEKIGPLSADAMIDRVKSGNISATHLVWHEGMREWKPFAKLAEHDSFQEIASIDQKIAVTQKPAFQSSFMRPSLLKTEASKDAPLRAKAAPQQLKL